MRKIVLIFIAILFGVSSVQSQEYKTMIDSGTYSVAEIISNAETYYADKDKGRGSGYVQFKRWEYMAKRLMDENGKLPSIVEKIAELEAFNAYLNETSENRQSLTDNWEELGPQDWNATTSWNPGVGRITGIAVDKNNHNHIIIGANTGGVWKTEDGGDTWAPLGDYFSNLYVYSVAIAPQDPNTYFFGSSDGFIYKSTDAGATWNLLGDIGTSIVNKIVIHPTDSLIMFATSQDGGIKKSIDGGITWSLAVSDIRGYDIEFKPGDPTVVYASGRSFHKSIDGGATFTTLSGFSLAPKMIGVSQDDPSVVYMLEASEGSFGGLYKSIDSGDSFNELDHEGRNYFGYDPNGYESGGQAPRDMDIAVNPNDINEVHIAGILTWRSADGGVTFFCTSDWTPTNATAGNIGYCHADVDILEFVGSTLFVGTDGGIYKATDTDNIDVNYYTDITAGIGIRQFYKIGVSQTEEVVVTGGSQDNGTSFYTEANGWKDWIGADGMEGFVDKDNSSIMYGTTQFGDVYRTLNGATTISYVYTPDAGEWVTPFEQDPTDANTIYIGLNMVYKSINKGASWFPISQDFGNNINQFKIAASNNQVMYLVRGVKVYRTEDGGASDWEQMTIPSGLVNSLAIHPNNPNKVAVATTAGNKVFVSEDGGVTWENYKLNLPSFAALALVWDDNGNDGLYLGMDYGLFYIDNTLTEWQPYNTNLPNVIINELEINNVDEKIYAGTYGRGLWASPIVPHVLNTEDFLTKEQVALSPNPAQTNVIISISKTVEADIKVFDVMGKLMQYRPDILIINQYNLDISTLNKGVYFVRINTDSGTITKKLLVE